MRLLWILVPLVGLAVLAFYEWLKFKKQTTRLGSSAAELESSLTSLREEIGNLQEERRALVQRIQNLETIVTSEVWDTLASDRDLAQAKGPQLELPEPEDVDESEQAAKIARKLRH